MLENISSNGGVLDTLREITAERAEREKLLCWRYPWFNVVYNYVIAILILALSVSFYGWGLDVWTRHRADAQAAEQIAAYQAEQQAVEAARLKEIADQEASAEAVIDKEAREVAKAFYGIRNFIDKYNYTDKDLETYARCMFNRVDSGNGINSLAVIIATPEQFLGYGDSNPVLDNYYQIAKDNVTAWHNEDVKPVDSSYRYAELRPEGIFLTAEFGAGPYARRWHA